MTGPLAPHPPGAAKVINFYCWIVDTGLKRLAKRLEIDWPPKNF
jgi:hypothetical protein